MMEKFYTSFHHLIRQEDPEKRSWYSLATSLLVSALAGTAYAYGAFNPAIKSLLNYTQKEITLLGSMGQFGMFLGVLTGTFYDHMGSRITLITGSLLSAICYLILYFQFSLQISSSIETVICAYFFSNLGNSFRVSSAVAVCIKNFPASQRGKMVGLAKGYFAVGSSIYSQLYLALFRGKVDTFFLFLTFEALIFMVLCYPYYVDIPYETKKKLTMEEQYTKEKKEKLILKHLGKWYILTAAFVIFLTTFSVCQQKLHRGVWNRIVCLIGLTVIISAMILLANRKPRTSGDAILATTSPLDIEAGINPTAGTTTTTTYVAVATPTMVVTKDKDVVVENTTTKNSTDLHSTTSTTVITDIPLNKACRKLTFWVLFFCFFCLCGCSLIVINNIAQIKYSLLKTSDAYMEVTIIGIGSLVGRMGMGIISDYYKSKIPREAFMVVCASITTFAMGLFLSGNSNLIIPGCIFTSLAYGGIFCLVPAITADYYGSKYYAGNYGAIDLAPAIGTFVYASAFVNIFYKDVKVGKVIHNCYGLSCFHGSFIICIVSGFIGIALAILLYKIRVKH